MQPTQGDLHVNGLLSNLSLQYMQEMDHFVADKVFPVITVQNQSDRFAQFSRADFNRNDMQKRADATESAGGDYQVDTTATYFAEVWAKHHDIGDQRRSNADSVFNLDAQGTRILSNSAMINKEVAWASAFFAASLWTTDWTGVAASPTSTQVLQWSDYNASAPIPDVRRMCTAIALVNGGFRPNKMVMGRQVFDALADHPDFIERIKYGNSEAQPSRVTRAAMASLFEMEEVLVMDAIVNNGQRQAGPDSGGTSINAGESNAFIGGKGLLLAHTPSAPGMYTPGCGYCFSWTGYLGANALGGRLKNFRIEPKAADRLEIEIAYVYKKVMSEMGGFIASVIA